MLVNFYQLHGITSEKRGLSTDIPCKVTISNGSIKMNKFRQQILIHSLPISSHGKLKFIMCQCQSCQVMGWCHYISYKLFPRTGVSEIWRKVRHSLLRLKQLKHTAIINCPFLLFSSTSASNVVSLNPASKNGWPSRQNPTRGIQQQMCQWKQLTLCSQKSTHSGCNCYVYAKLFLYFCSTSDYLMALSTLQIT
jgi:hypothetical protein